jgi:hypothetical protein
MTPTISHGTHGCWRARVAFVTLVAAAFPQLTTAQATPVRPLTVHALPKPIFEYPEPFSYVGSVRELPGGRIILADTRDRLLFMVDVAGRANRIGNTGSGPGEYLAPIALFPAPGDSTLVYDIGNQRLLHLDPNGRPTGTGSLVTMFAGAERPLRQMAPLFGDRTGRLFARGYAVNQAAPGSGGGEDSAALVRYDRALRRADTLGFLRLPPPIIGSVLGRNGVTLTTSSTPPFATQDGWAVALDGRVAVVHAALYQVEWIRGDGSRIVAPATPYDRVPVTAGDKAEVTDPKNQKRMVGAGPGSEFLPDRSAPPAITTWPEFKPPFRFDSPIVAPDGRLWVERSRAFRDSVRVYDLFDDRGELVERVALPPNTRFVGFGDGTLYLARIDTDDLEHLQRYRR